MNFKIKDYVQLKNEPDIYIVEEVISDEVFLKGLTYRNMISTKVDNLVLANINDVNQILDNQNKVINKFKTSSLQRNPNHLIYGTILHIDGDKEYLDSCMSLYKEMNIFANGIYIKEEDVKNKKPDPEIYNKIMQHYGASPDECLIFEDSYTGVLASKNAGIEVINIYDKYADLDRNKINLITDYSIINYRQFIDYLERTYINPEEVKVRRYNNERDR